MTGRRRWPGLSLDVAAKGAVDKALRALLRARPAHLSRATLGPSPATDLDSPLRFASVLVPLLFRRPLLRFSAVSQPLLTELFPRSVFPVFDSSIIPRQGCECPEQLPRLLYLQVFGPLQDNGSGIPHVMGHDEFALDIVREG